MKVKTGFGNAWEGIKRVSQRTIDALSETDDKKAEEDRNEERDKKPEDENKH